MFARKSQVVFLVFVWTIVHLLVFWRLGIRTLYDSKGYVAAADYFLAEQSLQDMHHVFYAVPILILALTRFLFGDTVVPFLILQILTSGLAMVALYKTAVKAFEEQAAGFFSVLLFLLWWDNIQWNTAVLTESIFCSLTMLILYIVISGDRTLRYYVTIASMAIILFLTRPTAVVVIVGIVGYALAENWQMIGSKIWRVRMVFVLLAVVSVVAAGLMFHHWDFTEQYVEGNIVTYMNTIKDSDLYYESLRLSTEQLILPDPDKPSIVKIVTFVYQNPIHFLKAFFLKIGYLVTGVRPYYSSMHNCFIIIWMIFIYFLFYLGVRTLKDRNIKLLVFIIICVNGSLVGISTVDWDNRFYVPMQPVIVLMAAGGASHVYRRVLKVSGQYL